MRQLDRGDATPERIARAFGYSDVDAGGRRRVFDSHLDRLREDHKINAGQYEAGTRYVGHWEGSGFHGRLGSHDFELQSRSNVINFDGLARGDSEVYHREEYRRALMCLGRIHSRPVEIMLCHGTGLGVYGQHYLGYRYKQSAVVAALQQLRDALDMLRALWRI